MAKPTSKPDWTVGNPSFGTVTIEPSAGKKQTGWTSGERPPFQSMNWLFYNIHEWINYLDAVYGGIYNAIVSTGPEGTHASLSAALADPLVTSGARILVKESATLNSTIQVTKNNVRIEFAPGVTYSKGTATTALQISADGVKVMDGRFAGFSGGGDIAILVDAGSDYCQVRDTRFASCTTEVSDLNGGLSIFGTITE